MTPIVKVIEVGPMGNFAYLVGSPKTKKALVIDGAWESERITGAAVSEGLHITHLLYTHAHFDHFNKGSVALQKETGAKVFVSSAEKEEIPKGLDVTDVKDGDKITLGDIEVICYHTPGHTPGAICYKIGKLFFTGDTLFIGSIGRTDLPGGDPAKMFASLALIKKMPDDLIVYPGHNYGAQVSSTLGEEKRNNPFLCEEPT